MLSAKDTLMIPAWQTPTKWRVLDENDYYSDAVVSINQEWTHRAIINAVRKGGINVPHKPRYKQDYVTVQNDLQDGRIFIQLHGQEWLILEEVSNVPK